MRSRVVYFIVAFASISLNGAACSAPPPPPTPMPQQITGSITPYNNKTELEVNQPATFEIGIIPTEAKAKVSSVNVYPDGQIGGTCTPSDKSMFTWYCTPAKESPVGMILADIKGDFPDIQAKYPVKAVASTQTLPSTSVSTLAPTGTENTSTPTVSPTPSSPVTIDLFKDGEVVPCENRVEGTYSADIKDPIWPMVYISSRYHPQDDGGEPAIKSQGRWYATVRFGDCNDLPSSAGKQFQLLIVTANTKCDQAFRDYLTQAHRDNKYPGMLQSPQALGCTEHAHVVVTRN
jgi:hypothetical protein